MKPDAKRILIMGIETSCDETAVAVVENGSRILSNLIASQVDIHARFGGVVPEIASRRHLELINQLIDDALRIARVELGRLDALAVSYGPGLVGALLVGVATAKALAYAARLPLVAVNHLEAHFYANMLTGTAVAYPLVVLIASGGHTELLLYRRPAEPVLLGQTRDDAAGEVFDKVARALKLGYPGGPLIDRLAQSGNPEAIAFPRAYLDEASRYDFSFSGLKSAVINYLHQRRQKANRLTCPTWPLLSGGCDRGAGGKTILPPAITAPPPCCWPAAWPRTAFCAGTCATAWHKNCPARRCVTPWSSADNAAMIAAAAYPLPGRPVCRPDLNAVPGLTAGCGSAKPHK